MDIVDELESLALELNEYDDPATRAKSEITRLRAQVAELQNKLAEGVAIADRHAREPADSGGRLSTDYSMGWQDAAMQILAEIEGRQPSVSPKPKDETK